MTGLVTVAFLAAFCVLQFSEKWRYDPDQPAAADAILVLAGDPMRAKHAADLYRLGFAPMVYVVRPTERAIPPEEDVNRDILRANGVPETGVRVFSEAATNTLAEATVANAELPPGVNRLLVVTSSVHVRRARIIFNDLMSRRGAKIAVVAGPGVASETPWWSTKASAIQHAKEALKAFLYVTGIRYSSW